METKLQYEPRQFGYNIHNSWQSLVIVALSNVWHRSPTFVKALCIFWHVSNLSSDTQAPFKSHFHQFHPEDTKAFLGQPKDVVSLACPCSTLVSPPGWACLKHVPRRHPSQMLNYLSWVLSTWRSRSSTPSCTNMSVLLLLSQRLSPDTPRRKINLATKRSHQQCSVWYYKNVAVKVILCIRYFANIADSVNKSLCHKQLPTWKKKGLRKQWKITAKLSCAQKTDYFLHHLANFSEFIRAVSLRRCSVYRFRYQETRCTVFY